MKNIKIYLKYFGISFLAIMLGLLFISTLYYFDIIGTKFNMYFRTIYFLVIIFVTSYKLGKLTDKNGYLTGIKFGLIYILIFILISLIFYVGKIHLRIIIYYLIILFTSILGSIMGIQKK